jgi:hypothetical protein
VKDYRVAEFWAKAAFAIAANSITPPASLDVTKVSVAKDGLAATWADTFKTYPDDLTLLASGTRAMSTQSGSGAYYSAVVTALTKAGYTVADPYSSNALTQSGTRFTHKNQTADLIEQWSPEGPSWSVTMPSPLTVSEWQEVFDRYFWNLDADAPFSASLADIPIVEVMRNVETIDF